MDAIVTWNKGLSFTGTANSGFKIQLGADKDVGGDDDGFRPLELMALSLAGCTGMDVISILLKKREVITAFEVKVHHGRAEQYPKVFTDAVLEFHVTGHGIKENSVLRSIELSSEIYCPAQAMLSQIMPIEIKYFIYEDLGEDIRTLVSTGVYKSN